MPDNFLTVNGRWVNEPHSTEAIAAMAAELERLKAPAPLPQRLVAAADTIAELNASQGLSAERAAVSPKYLREIAANMEFEAQP